MSEWAMLLPMDDPRRAEADERVQDALTALRRALDAADPQDCAFVLDRLQERARRLDPERSM